MVERGDRLIVVVAGNHACLAGIPRAPWDIGDVPRLVFELAFGSQVEDVDDVREKWIVLRAAGDASGRRFLGVVLVDEALDGRHATCAAAAIRGDERIKERSVRTCAKGGVRREVEALDGRRRAAELIRRGVA